MCSLWPGVVQAEILMSVLQPGLHEVIAYSGKVMERASCGSPGSNMLSPGINKKTRSYFTQHTRTQSLRYGSEVKVHINMMEALRNLEETFV